MDPVATYGPSLAALITAVGALIAGIVAWRKASSDAEHSSAEAAGFLVDGAQDLVTMLRDELAETKQRIEALEHHYGVWDEWGDRVVAVLDRAMTQLSEEHRAALQADVDGVKRTRPRRH